MVCSHPSRSRGGLLGRRLHLYLAASCTARVTASEPVQPVRGVWSDWSPVRRQAKQGVRAPTPTCAERKRRRGREGAGFDSGRARECKLQRGESTVGGWLGRVGARGKSFTRLDPGSGEGKGGLEVRAPPAPSGRVSCNRIHCIQGLQKQASCCLLLQDEQRLQGRKLPYYGKISSFRFHIPPPREPATHPNNTCSSR